MSAVGDSLTSAGVNLQSVYGTTETGPLCRYGVLRERDDWSWIEISDKINIKWVDQGHGTYECHCLVCGVILVRNYISQLVHRKENCTNLRL